MNSSSAGALSSIRSSARCGARDQLPAANSNCSMPSSAAVVRRSLKDSSPRLSVIIPIFIALPSQSRSRRHCTQMSKTEPGISERRRLCRILIGLDDQPAAIVHRRQRREHPAKIDAAVARHGKDAVENGIEKTLVACSNAGEDVVPHILAVDMRDAVSVTPGERG